MKDHAEAAPQVGSSQFRNVDTVKKNSASVEFVETHEKVHQGGLPRSGRPYQGHDLARFDAQVQAVEKRPVGEVAEAEPFDNDFAANSVQSLREDGVGSFFSFVEEGEDPFPGRQGRLEDVGGTGRLSQRKTKLAEIHQKRLDIAHRKTCGAGGQESPRDADSDVAKVVDQVHQRHHDSRQKLSLSSRVVQAFVDGLEHLNRCGLAAKSLNLHVARDHFFNVAAQFSQRFLLLGKVFPRPFGDRSDDKHHKGHDHQGNEREDWADPNHHRQGTRKRDGRGNKLGQRLL